MSQNLSIEQKFELLFQKIQELERKNQELENRVKQLEYENEKNVEEEDLELHTQKKMNLEKKLKEEYIEFENNVKEDPTSYYKHWDELIDLNSKMQHDNKCETLKHLFDYIQYHEKKSKGKIVRTLLLKDNHLGEDEAKCIIQNLQENNANLIKIELEGNNIDQNLLSSINQLLRENNNSPNLAFRRINRNLN